MALMEQWQDAVSEQIKLLTDRLNEILSKGLDWLRVELQLDLGLKPELVPPWIILCAACTGLFLLVALWASVCRAVFKKRITVSSADDGIEGKPTTSKPTKPEDPKKKKRKEEKKAQPNGRTVLEPHDEELVPLNQQIQADTKTEKVAETKKSKKKVKQAVKETKIVTDDGREPEEGTWETKVSNKEKREQRKKDKSSSDGSASPGGGSTPVSPPPKQPKASAAPPAPVSQKKRKEESTKVKAEKLAAVVPPANSSGAAEVAASVANTTVKATPNAAAPDMSWTTQRQPAPIWRTGIDDSWTVIDRPITSPDLSLSSLAGLGVGTAEPLPVRDLPWLSQSRVDDVWSGLNGSSADPSSDWNAPSEAWGNFEEPTPEAVVAQELLPPKVNLTRAVEEDEDDKDKGDDGAVKTKKKKQKKKKKVAEEGGASGQVEERVMEKPAVVSVKKQQPAQEKTAMMQPVKAAAVESERGKQDTVISQKIPVTQVPQTPSDDLSAPTPQKKPEENQAAKPVKKKKVRRET